MGPGNAPGTNFQKPKPLVEPDAHAQFAGSGATSGRSSASDFRSRDPQAHFRLNMGLPGFRPTTTPPPCRSSSTTTTHVLLHFSHVLLGERRRDGDGIHGRGGGGHYFRVRESGRRAPPRPVVGFSRRARGGEEKAEPKGRVEKPAAP